MHSTLGSAILTQERDVGKEKDQRTREKIPTGDLSLGLLGAGALREGRCHEKRNEEAKVPQVEHRKMTSSKQEIQKRT